MIVRGIALVIIALALSFGMATADDCGMKIVYEGKGAGEVLFDISSHISKGLSCSDCHERKGFTPPLFEMKKGASGVSMKKMALGLSCGYCHDGGKAFSSMDGIQCSRCHRK